MTKRIKLNKKQIGISLQFAYTKYKVQKAIFKSAPLDFATKIDQKNYRKS